MQIHLSLPTAPPDATRTTGYTHALTIRAHRVFGNFVEVDLPSPSTRQAGHLSRTFAHLANHQKNTDLRSSGRTARPASFTRLFNSMLTQLGRKTRIHD